MDQTRSFAMALSALSLMGCQLFVDLPEHQCAVDRDCTTLLGDGFFCPSATLICERIPPEDLLPPLPEQWSCLRDNLPSAADLPPKTEDTDKIHLSFAAITYTTHERPPGLTARACLASDVDCGTPYEEGIQLDDNGYLNFDLPYRFSGRIEMETTDQLPMLWYMNRPLTADLKAFGASFVSQKDIEALASRSEDELSTELGIMIFAVFDCNDEPAAGVSVKRADDASDLRFYFDGPLPDQDLTETHVSTDLSHDGSPIAAGGFFNAKPGFVTYEFTLAETGDLISEVTVEIKSGYMTTVAIWPGEY